MNGYYSATDTTKKLKCTLCDETIPNIFYDTSIKRCVKCENSDSCYKEYSETVYITCGAESPINVNTG